MAMRSDEESKPAEGKGKGWQRWWVDGGGVWMAGGGAVAGAWLVVWELVAEARSGSAGVRVAGGAGWQGVHVAVGMEVVMYRSYDSTSFNRE